MMNKRYPLRGPGSDVSLHRMARMYREAAEITAAWSRHIADKGEDYMDVAVVLSNRARKLETWADEIDGDNSLARRAQKAEAAAIRAEAGEEPKP